VFSNTTRHTYTTNNWYCFNHILSYSYYENAEFCFEYLDILKYLVDYTLRSFIASINTYRLRLHEIGSAPCIIAD